MSDLEPYDDYGSYEMDSAPPAAVGGIMGLLAARAGRKVDKSRTDNRRTLVNFLSHTTVVNDNRRSIFPGKERRKRRWE